VADTATGAPAANDAELLNRVRTGDTTAFGVLYQRHVGAVRRLARELVMSPAEADHLTAETFALVHDVTQRGGGPTDAFRPYVLTALRRVAADQVRDWRLPSTGRPDPGEPLAEPGTISPDNSDVARAFLSLPERWRAVLWHTDIEQEPAADVAPLLGVSASGVGDLRRRAREGLRQAIVRTHVARAANPQCRPVAERLDEYQRGTLAEADKSSVASHLSDCAGCMAVLAALGGITAALCEQVAPVFLGAASLPYLLGSRAAIAPEPGAAVPADTREFRPVGGAAKAGVLHQVRQLPRRVWAVGAAVLAACAVAAAAVAATSSPGPGHDGSAGAHASIVIKPSPDPSQQVQSPSPSPSATRSRRHRPSATSKPAATTAPPTTAPAVTVQLTAAISIRGNFGFLPVSFQVGNTGNAATGQVSATFAIPSGAMFVGMSRHGDNGGWTCQAASGGASCQHAAISAGSQATGTIFIVADRSACGQPVQFSAASGSATVSAESQDIPCSRDD
jgi:DNA-directed RNA polymerase specialized sigma24 family protein